MEEEIVDVLLATYNTNIEFLKIQIDSILNQTYKQIKLYISDDNSTNQDVLDLLDKYQQKDNRIKIFHQKENIGVNKNFEFLLMQSKSRYIMFSDHDDIWYLNKIEELLKNLKETKVDLVYSDARQVDENGNVLHESYLKYKSMPKIKGRDNIITFSRHIAIGCSQMFTSDVKNRMLPFKNVIAHDWISVFIADKLKGVSYLDKPLFDYRLHESNVFGGRSFKQNLNLWKRNYGNSNKSYLKYREKAIKESYLNGAKMCYEYEKNETEKKIIDYYENILKTKIINFDIYKYFKYLASKDIGKRMIKEIILFHFPIIGYIIFKIV